MGWTSDAGSSPGNTGATFNGNPLTGVRSTIAGGFYPGPYNGTTGSHELFYANVGELPIGSYSWYVGSDSNKPGAAIWIVDGVVGLRDTAAATYIADNNPGSRAFGFNLPGGTIGTPGELNPSDFATDEDFQVQNGDVVIFWHSFGADFGTVSGSVAITGDATEHLREATIGNGGAFIAASTASSTGSAYGVDDASAFFRAASTAISFETVPEPSAAALVLLAMVPLLRRYR